MDDLGRKVFTNAGIVSAIALVLFGILPLLGRNSVGPIGLVGSVSWVCAILLLTQAYLSARKAKKFVLANSILFAFVFTPLIPVLLACGVLNLVLVCGEFGSFFMGIGFFLFSLIAIATVYFTAYKAENSNLSQPTAARNFGKIFWVAMLLFIVLYLTRMFVVSFIVRLINPAVTSSDPLYFYTDLTYLLITVVIPIIVYRQLRKYSV